MIKNIFLTSIIFSFFATPVFAVTGENIQKYPKYWNFQSIDTMKVSRDEARLKLSDRTFDSQINDQMSQIFKTGATHVVVATPYDEEFWPYIARWVKIARKNNLNIWFRGNMSGWEKWFDYPQITKEQHIELTLKFIKNNKALFENNDYFSSCPECENGNGGDSLVYQDITAHREFLIEEYNAIKAEFKKIGKDVKSNMFSMNYDIALKVMDPITTAKLDGIVVIDHYVASPDKLADDIVALANYSKGKIILGEWGAPIPDIHGTMDEEEQNNFIDKALGRLIYVDQLIGLNYWTNIGGTTSLWSDAGEAKIAVKTLTDYYKPKNLILKIKSDLGLNVKNVRVDLLGKIYLGNNSGEVTLPSPAKYVAVKIEAPRFHPTTIDIAPGTKEKFITIVSNEATWWERVWSNILRIIGLI